MKKHHLVLVVCFSIAVGILAFSVAHCGTDMDCWASQVSTNAHRVALGFVLLGVAIGLLGDACDIYREILSENFGKNS